MRQIIGENENLDIQIVQEFEEIVSSIEKEHKVR